MALTGQTQRQSLCAKAPSPYCFPWTSDAWGCINHTCGFTLSFINSLDKAPLCFILLYYFLLLHFPSLFSFPGTMLGGINGQLYFINGNAMRQIVVLPPFFIWGNYSLGRLRDRGRIPTQLDRSRIHTPKHYTN